MFPTLQNRISFFSFTFIVSSANALNWYQSKFLSFGKELTSYRCMYLQQYCTQPSKYSCILMTLGEGFLKHCGFNSSPHSSDFLTNPENKALEITKGRGENACYKQFLLFSPCLLPYMVLIFFIYLRCSLKCLMQLV